MSECLTRVQHIYLNKNKVDKVNAEAEADDASSDLDSDSTIKSGSPFTKHFLDIQTIVLNALFSIFADNTLRNAAFFSFLHEEFLPYIGLWASFTLRDMPFAEHTTHITNGTVERWFGSRKRLIGHHPKSPNEYIELTYQMTLGKAIYFVFMLSSFDLSLNLSLTRIFECECF